jgi:hypothetical protein
MAFEAVRKICIPLKLKMLTTCYVLGHSRALYLEGLYPIIDVLPE